MITREEILGNNKCPPELEENLKKLLEAVNLLRSKYGRPMFVNSGFRTPEHNAKVGGAKNSRHCLCLAVDFRDNDGKLKEFCRANDYQVLKECGLWMEDGEKTKTWLHVDITPRQNREFKI